MSSAKVILDDAFEVTDWKAYEKNTLRGFLSLELPSGLTIHGCTLHEKGDSRWVGFPGQKYTKDDGSTSYATILEITESGARRRFQEAALAAIDQFSRRRATMLEVVTAESVGDEILHAAELLITAGAVHEVRIPKAGSTARSPATLTTPRSWPMPCSSMTGNSPASTSR